MIKRITYTLVTVFVTSTSFCQGDTTSFRWNNALDQIGRDLLEVLNSNDETRLAYFAKKVSPDSAMVISLTDRGIISEYYYYFGQNAFKFPGDVERRVLKVKQQMAKMGFVELTYIGVNNPHVYRLDSEYDRSNFTFECPVSFLFRANNVVNPGDSWIVTIDFGGVFDVDNQLKLLINFISWQYRSTL